MFYTAERDIEACTRFEDRFPFLRFQLFHEDNLSFMLCERETRVPRDGINIQRYAWGRSHSCDFITHTHHCVANFYLVVFFFTFMSTGFFAPRVAGTRIDILFTVQFRYRDPADFLHEMKGGT